MTELTQLLSELDDIEQQQVKIADTESKLAEAERVRKELLDKYHWLARIDSSFWLIATSSDESRPPLRNAPNGTSDASCRRREPSRISPMASTCSG